MKPEASRKTPPPDAGVTKIAPQEAALAASAVLLPLCWCAWAMAAWRLGADMGFAREFFVNEGLLSHWQVWFALGAGLQVAAGRLRRQRVDSE